MTTRATTLFSRACAILVLATGCTARVEREAPSVGSVGTQREPLQWQQVAELVSNDGAATDLFGYSVSVSGDVVLVGAEDKTLDGHNDQGAAYVFVGSGTSWTQSQELVSSDGAVVDIFGSSVSISGGTALIGAVNKMVGVFQGQGAAYLFAETDAGWTQQQEVNEADGGMDDMFGDSVSVSGSTAIVGARRLDSYFGTAYVFFQDVDGGWTRFQQLFGEGTGNDFGRSVSVSGGMALVGAPASTIGANAQQGAAYVFDVSDPSVPASALQLIASDGAPADEFGYSVSVDGANAVVGAYNKNHGQGAAYVLQAQSDGGWAEQQELLASNGAAADGFGYAVAVSGGRILVGAIGANSGQGAAYVFVQQGGTWLEEQELVPGDGGQNSGFAASVSLSGTTAVVGAPVQAVGGNSQQGAVYVYVLTDAGAADAGMGGDAGTGDAGTDDAGLDDAGGFDAGFGDAGPIDAGFIDAGVMDSGVADGGGPGVDAGFTADAGKGADDAGTPTDAGMAPDGGHGAQVDSGTPPDAGATLGMSGGGCGCGAVDSTPVLLLGLALLRPKRRR